MYWPITLPDYVAEVTKILESKPPSEVDPAIRETNSVLMRLEIPRIDVALFWRQVWGSLAEKGTPLSTAVLAQSSAFVRRAIQKI